MISTLILLYFAANYAIFLWYLTLFPAHPPPTPYEVVSESIAALLLGVPMFVLATLVRFARRERV